jgi:glycosyltransferase involved in cell wall biosynthesis
LVIVPSQFVRSTLIQHNAPASSIAVVPFGSPHPIFDPPPTRSGSSPFRILFVGSLGQRKGLSYALDALYALGAQAALTLIGRPTSTECAPLHAALSRHRWIETLPHAQILDEMRQHDVLVLPSLFEGYALVISEALSQGLPVIATSNTGASESVRDGLEGFIVPIRDSQAIAERIQQLIDDPELHESMRHACSCRAAVLNWSSYQDGLLSAAAAVI